MQSVNFTEGDSIFQLVRGFSIFEEFNINSISKPSVISIYTTNYTFTYLLNCLLDVKILLLVIFVVIAYIGISTSTRKL